MQSTIPPQYITCLNRNFWGANSKYRLYKIEMINEI